MYDSIRQAKTFGGAIVFGVVMLTGCTNDQAIVQEPSPRPAKLYTVKASSNQTAINLPIVVEAATITELAFLVSGRVESVTVREGQSVDEGDELARLDQSDFLRDLEAAKSTFDKAISELQRFEQLIETNVITQAQFESKKTTADLEKSSLETIQKRLADSVLRAPFTGVVAQVHIEAFQNVFPQSSAITLQSESNLQAVGQAPAKLIANAKNITYSDVIIRLDAASETEIPGSVYSFSPRADSSGQIFEARIAFEAPENLNVLPGMTGTVESSFSVHGEEAGFTVPLTALFMEANSHFVWVVEPNTMKVNKRMVSVDDAVGDYLPVTSGLEEGEVIVATGVSFLYEGMQVRRFNP